MSNNLHKSPAFQFYPQDYISSTRVAEMTLEEEGVYIRLLCYCWSKGSIPSDPERCAKLAGKGCSVVTATNVQRAFNVCSTDSQRLVHDRLEFEREQQRIRRESCSKAGKKSAAKRALKSTPATTKNGRSTDVQRKSNTSSSSSDEDGGVVSAETQDVPLFADFWMAYPKKVAKGAAERAWKTAVKKVDPKKIVDAVSRYAEISKAKDPQYIPNPATWLNGKCWDDELPPPVDPKFHVDGTPKVAYFHAWDSSTPEGRAAISKHFMENLHKPD